MRFVTQPAKKLHFSLSVRVENPLTLLNYSDYEKHTMTVKTPLTMTKMIKELNVNGASD